MKFVHEGLERDTDDLGWFADKVCIEPTFEYRGSGWEFPANYQKIPVCGRCGLWANRVMLCCRCNHLYYQYFSHPRSDYHMRPVRGWYCWNCLETYLPTVKFEPHLKRPKIPPAAEVTPPGQEIKVRAPRVNRFAHL